ncbi:hypothetical protein KEM54_003083 [Ascosphaera aggregata]|nr:hypothetical protein KEM54_003083 [Ascosphaera aggregata]
MSSPSTTYLTFTVLTTRSIASVDLYGSWDKFTSPFKMERDNRCGRGYWKGCPTEIVCKAASKTLDGHVVGEKGLKMGATYWYYYVLDGDIDFHNPQEPSTVSCPLLPGQRINVLDVPILLPAAPDDQRGDFTGRKFVGKDESESKQLIHLITGRDIPQLDCIRQSQTCSLLRPLTAPARLAGGDITQPRMRGVMHGSEQIVSNEQCPSMTADCQYKQYNETNEPTACSAEKSSVAEPAPNHTSKTKKLRSAFQMGPLKTALVHSRPRARPHGKAAESEKRRLLNIHRRPESSSKKKKSRMTLAENRCTHDWEEGKGVRHLSNIFTKSWREDEKGAAVRHGHFHVGHGQLRQKLEHLAETKHSALRRRGRPPQELTGHIRARALDRNKEEPTSPEDSILATARLGSPCGAGNLGCSREGTASYESMTSASTFEHENETLLTDNLWPNQHHDASLNCTSNQLLNLRAHGVAECNNSQETVVLAGAVRRDQMFGLGSITCSFRDEISIQSPGLKEVPMPAIGYST